MRRRVLPFLLLTVSLICLSPYAMAQSGGGGFGSILPGILNSIGGTEVVIGFVLPPILSILMQSHWPWRAKANIAWIACFVVAVGVAATQGQLTGDWSSVSVIAAKFSTVLVIASQTFDKFWKPTGIADAVEKSTDLPTSTFDETSNTLIEEFNVLDETPRGDFNIEDFNTGAPIQPSSKVDLQDEALEKIASRVIDKITDLNARRL